MILVGSAVRTGGIVETSSPVRTARRVRCADRVGHHNGLSGPHSGPYNLLAFKDEFAFPQFIVVIRKTIGNTHQERPPSSCLSFRNRFPKWQFHSIDRIMT